MDDLGSANPADVDDEPAGPDLDAHDDAVLAADDTGMLAGERMITVVETDEGLRGDTDADSE